MVALWNSMRSLPTAMGKVTVSSIGFRECVKRELDSQIIAMYVDLLLAGGEDDSRIRQVEVINCRVHHGLQGRAVCMLLELGCRNIVTAVRKHNDIGFRPVDAKIMYIQ